MCAKGSQQTENVLVGDIVLVFSDTQPRGLWKLAKVEKLMKGLDGRVRGAFVKISTKKKGSIILKRPIQHLYPLEINCLAGEKEVQSDSSISPEVVEEPQPKPREKPPQRKAAKEGRNKVKNWIKKLYEIHRLNLTLISYHMYLNTHLSMYFLLIYCKPLFDQN